MAILTQSGSQERVADAVPSDADVIERQTYNIDEAARILGVFPHTLRAAIEDGEFYAIPIRNRKVVPKAYVDYLLSAGFFFPEGHRPPGRQPNAKKSGR